MKQQILPWGASWYTVVSTQMEKEGRANLSGELCSCESVTVWGEESSASHMGSSKRQPKPSAVGAEAQKVTFGGNIFLKAENSLA